MFQYFALFLLLQTISSFPVPGVSNPEDCEHCECSVKNWVCNIKCPDQQPGTREICQLEQYSQGEWNPSQPILQTANNFCQKGGFVNEQAHLGVGNFFQTPELLQLSSSLDCLSVRLGDENKRQKITFDLIPPISETPNQPELVIFERANGTGDGRLNARFESDPPEDNYLPEAFAFSLLVDGTWTKFFYSAVRATFVEYRGQMVPQWKNEDIGYQVDYDAWSTEIEFRDLGIPEGSVVSGVSIVNLQPGDMILGLETTFGEVVFQENVQTECLTDFVCIEPHIAEASNRFGPTDYDPDIVWIGPYTGQSVKRRNFM